MKMLLLFLKSIIIFFGTKPGVVKRSDANEFTSIRNNGLRAINMREEDELIKVLVTNGGENIIIGTHNANAMAFNEEDVRVMGRTATGVRGVKLRKGDYVVGAALLKPDSEVLVVTEKDKELKLLTSAKKVVNLLVLSQSIIQKLKI